MALPGPLHLAVQSAEVLMDHLAGRRLAVLAVSPGIECDPRVELFLGFSYDNNQAAQLRAGLIWQSR